MARESLSWKNRIVGYREEDPSQLLANPFQWRIHPPYQQEIVEASLDSFGWVDEITVNKRTGHVVDGHLRVLLALRRGERKVPVKYIDVSEQEERLILATLDPLSALATCDQEVLDSLLSEIETEEPAIELFLKDIAGKEGLDKGRYYSPEEDLSEKKAEKLQEIWKVERGQIFEFSSRRSPGLFHRLMCGDSTLLSDVELLMDGRKGALGFTSPPYWVGKEYEKEKSEKEIEDFIRRACRSYAFAIRKDESRIVINTGTGFTTSFEKGGKRRVLLLIDKWANSFYELGWNLRHIRHWIKEGGLSAISACSDLIDPHCEFLGTFQNQEGKDLDFHDVLPEDEVRILETFYHRNGLFRGMTGSRGAKRWALRSYWMDIRGTAREAGHPASFPVVLPARHILLYTKKHEIVVDLFVGAGTTIVACEKLKRIGFGMDLEPKYIALAIERLKDLGLEPKRVR